jgi:valyl-tRNA synthetase
LASVEEEKGIKMEEKEGKTLADRWILSRLSKVTERATNHLEKFELSQAGEVLRDFTWSEFADWYLEISKIQRADDKLKESTEQILLYVLSTVLKLWHPFMPFVTEEIWSHLLPIARGETRRGLLMIEDWPEIVGREVDNRQFERVREIIEKIRNWRAENKVEPKEKINVTLIIGEYFEIFRDLINLEIIKTLARLENLLVEESAAGGFTYQFKVNRQIDISKERDRFFKELAEAEKYLIDLDNKLANQEFISKAPAKVIDNMKQKRDEAAKKSATIKQQIENL